MVIDDEGRNVKEHGSKNKSIMKTELTKDEKQEHKNTEINGIMERMEEMKEWKSLCDGREVDHATWSVFFLQDKC